MKEILDSIDINSQNKLNGWTALHWAYKRNHTKIIEFLIKNGAKEIKNFKGEIPSDLKPIQSNYPSYLQQLKKVDFDGNPIDTELLDKEQKNDIDSSTRENIIDPCIPRLDHDDKRLISPLERDLPKRAKSVPTLQDEPQQRYQNQRELIVYQKKEQQQSLEIIGCVYYHNSTITNLVSKVELELEIKIRQLYKKGDLLVPIHKNQYSQSADLFFNGYQLAFQ